MLLIKRQTGLAQWEGLSLLDKLASQRKHSVIEVEEEVKKHSIQDELMSLQKHD